MVNHLAFLQLFDFVSKRRGALSSMIRLIDLKVIYSFNIIWIFNFLEINFRIYCNFESHQVLCYIIPNVIYKILKIKF